MQTRIGPRHRPTGRRHPTGEAETRAAIEARAGRLPGSVNVEGAQAYDAARNGLKDKAALEQLFAPAGEGAVIGRRTTCGRTPQG